MTVLSIGRGVKNPQAIRIDDLPSLADTLAELPADEERWWSGHLWQGDRRNKSGWMGSSCLMLDLDYLGTPVAENRGKGAHESPPEDLRLAAEEALNSYEGLYSAYHHTPRGLRVCLELPEVCTDEGRWKTLQKGFAAAVRRVLESVGASAVGGAHGYETDPQALLDLARLMYAPKAIVDGMPRTADIRVGTAGPETVRLIEEEAARNRPSLSDPGTFDRPDVDIEEELRKMPAKGQKDGSYALIRVARKAVGLGVETPEHFASVARPWNEKRRDKAWTEDELKKRFSDALHRWESEGLAKVPAGKYSIHALGKIFRQDREFEGRLCWDCRDETVLHKGSTGQWNAVNDVYVTGIRQRVSERYGYSQIPKDDCFAALRHASNEWVVDRVADYLQSLEAWDGVSRMSDLVKALRVEELPEGLAESYLRCTMIAACARTHRPGTKHDHLLVIVGPEGTLKSTFFKTLAGPENFNDTKISLDDKDGYMQIASAWIHEWAELEAVTRKADQAHLKNFLSSSIDRYRAPYARTIELHRRRCVFVGTSNTSEIIYDLDSDRRWWVLENNDTIDLVWVEKNRDKLWAEALHYYRAYLEDEKAGTHIHDRRGKWWLTADEEKTRAEVNEQYKPDNPREVAIRYSLRMLAKKDDHIGYFRTADIYNGIGLDCAKVSNLERRMVTAAMHKLGYKKKRLSSFDGDDERPMVWVPRSW